MAKTKLEINPKEFQKVVNDLEKKQEFPNLSALWNAVANTDWAKNLSPRPLTAAVALQRAAQLKIQTKTKPGKRGRQKGQVVQRTPKEQKLKQYNDTYQRIIEEVEAIQELPRASKDKYVKWAKSARKGNRRAAMNLKCLDCANYEDKEIRLCGVRSCSLYPFRPYKTKQEKELLKLNLDKLKSPLQEEQDIDDNDEQDNEEQENPQLAA